MDEGGSKVSEVRVAWNVFDSLASELAVLDREGNIIATNRAWQEFARENGAGPGDVGVGVNYLEVCSAASDANSEGAADIRVGLAEVLSGARGRFSSEYPCHSPRQLRWFLLQATRLQSAEGGALVLHVDITARKLLERRLREQQERFRVALEHSPVVVFNQDLHLAYTWINSPVLAWAEQDFLGRTDQEIVGGPEAEELMAIKRAVLDDGVGRRVETRVTFQGAKHYFDMTMEPMRDSKGSLQGITCCATDITPIKQAAAERERLIEELARSQRVLLSRNEELEALHAEKARWLGMATHDLRNPLGAILANCELLVDEPSIPAEHRATIRAVHSSGEFMLQLLNDVLDISAMESGSQSVRLEPTDLHLLMEESIAVTAPLARRKGTQVEATFEKSMPVVVAVDRHKMMQLFHNLIGNAIKFSQSGAKVELAVATEGRRILISVKDNGPGIPDGQLESIFRPFHRSTHIAEPGTGLGLAICKRIVERHGGLIRAENRAGGGAVFLVSLDRNFLEAMSA